jgi:2-polyprenyl-3-methyl-5-hydroxy-6-metoxy-1,4-benzoquinol methylase
MGWLKQMLDNGDSLNLLGADLEKLTMLKWGNTIDENSKISTIWHENVAKNMAYLSSLNGRVRSVREVPDLTGKAIILVGASPILYETWEYLKDIDDRFIIICSNSSAQFLVDRGIIPDYVLMIDGQKIGWDMNIGEENLKTAMIASPFCHPETLQSWKNKVYVLPYEIKDDQNNDVIRERYGEAIPSGGNSINCGFAFLVTCTNARIILFAGNELSFKKSYYVDKKSGNDQSMYFFAKNAKGETVRTLVPLYEYKMWLENVMWELYRQGYWFCNCSEGILGIDDGDKLECVDQMPLNEAIAQVKKALAFEKQDEMAKVKQMYDMLYHDSIYFPRNGIYTWISLISNMEKMGGTFKKGLDVGCGAGAGMVEALARGYQVWGCDIASNEDIWKEMNLAHRCYVAPAHDMNMFPDNEFDLVMCADVMEHIPESYVDRTLKEILRVGSDRFLFVIAIAEAMSVGGAVQTHCTVCSPQWWIDKATEAGFTVVHAQVEEEHHVVLGCIKENHDNN